VTDEITWYIDLMLLNSLITTSSSISDYGVVVSGGRAVIKKTTWFGSYALQLESVILAGMYIFTL
jgi:hypothetical protein